MLVAALAGGAAAWQLTGHQARPANAASGQTATGSAPASTTPGNGTPLTASPGAQTSPLTTTPPATQSPSGVTVTIAPGAAQNSAAAGVATFMAGYFNAINQRDYQGYMSKFEAQARPNDSRQKFLSDFGTTTDSSPNLVALTPTANGLIATVTFVSHQSPALSATNTACTDWNLEMYLESSGGGYLIGTPPSGSPQTTYAAC